MRDAPRIAELISRETGLPVAHSTGKDADGQPWITLSPEGADAKHTFAVRITIGWRRLEVGFEPGKFAAPLLTDMADADEVGQKRFGAVLDACKEQGADINLSLNGENRSYQDETLWDTDWKRFSLVLRKGDLEIGDDDAEPDIDIVSRWTSMFFAAVFAILPVEVDDEEPADNHAGFPEGASETVKVNRYERDRRNRAAAIAIHGTRCKACGLDFGERYGPIGQGFIEIHHVTPVSKLGEGYIIDPETDLVPLCSNCHSMVHRIDPPLQLEMLHDILKSGGEVQ